ncbi:MAG: hypothetical protein IPO88_12975 [Nannocystis sp.]|uniref:hypothetical protein n=1 Tax=Nannocystis sp. TaxID=1962667 RepID=UPI0024284D3A|nr:hypothetical protein [Nannocystis sp.]MBK9754397.1 hypothetical protein [Nannocystis sp.]
MPDTDRHGIWERLLSGRHAALVGLPMPAAPGELRLIRVSCDVPPSTLGPLHDARRRLELVLGEAPILEQARDRVLGGLRRRLLGEPPTTEIDAVLVDLGNRLADGDPRRSILVFEAVEAADPATLAILHQIILRPGWMRLPILLMFRSREPAGAAGSLLAALLASEGLAAVIQAPAGESATATTPTPDPTSLRGLGPEPLTTLRAGATIGTGFEVELCATLLEQRPLAVLLHLQAAIDHGVPLEDRGEGRIHMPPAIVEALRAGITPSLANYWHRRLAEILGGDPLQTGRADAEAASDTQAREAALLSAAESTPTPATITASTPATITTDPAPAITADPPPTITTDPPPTITTDPPPAPPAVTTPHAVTIELQPAPAPAPAPASPTPQAPVPRAEHPHVHAPHRHRRSPDAARAASHLHAIDEADDAAARYIQAARQAADQGLGAQGLGHARRALAILERLAPTDARRRLRIAALIELARIQWSSLGTDLGTDAHLTLETALITARQALAAVVPGDPPALQAEVALVIAGVGYDRGDLRALEEALAALMSASQALMAAGDARGAAALLNDQAAIYIRLGDHVRATHLLVSSRQVFEAAGDDDKVALRELADTHHLLARVPLHAPLRPGREDDALSMALDHALVAEKLLRRLGDARAVARVWETMGRIEIAKRRHERAGQRLAAALEVQRSLGDAIGMARTTAALADLLAETGQIRESLGVLASSIGLNREKGSPLGLGLNRRALQRLRPRITDTEDAVALARVEAALAAAEQLLGRYPLPEGQGDGPR